nr:PREDICTED: putative ankyrin repeat protein RF_0381 isoform X1 [Tribolium castaneum]|eukprot:XP_015839974.1 PREDICTED: putative ankyrin repeat protein RF_0381 isoform X1 [Tribolium castaneum]
MVESIPLEAIGPKEAVKPDATDKEKKAFFKAIKAKNSQKIKKFSKEYKLNFCFKEYTPLILALKKLNTLDVVKDLIENGAKVNYKDKDGWAPLHVAINNECSLDIIKLLIEHKAGINEVARYTCGSRKYTPLSVSVIKNNFEAFTFLIDKKANMTKENSDKTTALSLAQSNNRTEMLNYYYYGPLGYAIFTENLIKARQLLEDGADVFTTGPSNKTPLVIAVEKDSFKAIILLFEFGAKLTMQTAFLEAVNLGKIDIINFFIQHKVDINRKYLNGTTPLLKAVENENFHVVKTLIEKDATVDFSDNTLLLKAIGRGDLDVVKLLIEKGASVNSTDGQNSNPLFESLKLDNCDITKYLISKGAKMEAKYLVKNNFQHLQNLIKSKADLKNILQDQFESSILQKVVETKNAFFVKYLLDYVLSLNSNDIEHELKRLLGIAAKNHSFSIVKILIDAKADIASAEDELEEFAKHNDDFDVYYQELKQKLSKKSSADGDADTKTQ